jgi:DNA-directed RNA polymerase specialized sigma24 family protein
MSLSKPSLSLQSDDLAKLFDEELMQHATTGRHDALAILFDRYHRLVFDVALRIVRDPGEAEDVVQNVFLDVFRAMANFDSSKGILKVWVLQYAYHRALHRKRHLVSNHFYRWENLETAIEVVRVEHCGASCRRRFGSPKKCWRTLNHASGPLWR